MRTARQEAGHEARRATPALIKALAVLFNKRKDFDKRMGYVHDCHKTPWAGPPGTMLAKRVIPNAFQWNEAVLEPGDPLNNGLLSLLVIKDDLSPKLIGTAFLVAAEGDSATAISAAHCFEEIRRHVDPDNQRHHPSTHFD
jgi:hypothetical protein